MGNGVKREATLGMTLDGRQAASGLVLRGPCCKRLAYSHATRDYRDMITTPERKHDFVEYPAPRKREEGHYVGIGLQCLTGGARR